MLPTLLFQHCDQFAKRPLADIRPGSGTGMQVPPKLRQQRLGHSDERMMLRYEHVVSQDEINLANKLGEMLEVVN